MKAGLLHDLLTRGLDEHGHLRDPGRHPEQFQDSPVGRIPSAWEVFKLGDLCDMKTGGTPDRGNPRFWNGSIPWVKTAEINYAPISEAEEAITEQGLAHSAARLIPRGTLLMAIYGEGVTRGRVALLAIDAAINQACLAFFPRGTVVTPFLFHYFAHGYERLRRLSNEGSQKNLSSQILADLLVATPSKPEQEKLVDCLDSWDARIAAEESQLSKLHSLKRGLAHDPLTGRVRVKLTAA